MPALKTCQFPQSEAQLVLRTVTEREDIKPLRLALRKGHYPGARQLILITRTATCVSTGKVTVESRIFIASLEPGEKSPAQLAALIRDHWSVENKNHWKRDASRWREDRGRRRHPSGAKNLALDTWSPAQSNPLGKF